MASTAQKVREEKENHPERFCAHRGCLWRTKPAGRPENPCRKHAASKCEGCGVAGGTMRRVNARGTLVVREVRWCATCADFALGPDGAFAEVPRS
jgi:hypothetical protein